MSRTRIAVLAVVALVVIAVGVGVGVSAALAHRDRERAEAAAAAIAAAQVAAEQERAESCKGYLDAFTETIEEEVDRERAFDVKYLADSMADRLLEHGCALDAATFREHYLAVADDLYSD